MKVLETPYAGLSTEALWTLRSNMERGVLRTAEQYLSGGLPSLGEGAVDSVHLRVTQVEAIDAVLLSRGEKVKPPFWE